MGPFKTRTPQLINSPTVNSLCLDAIFSLPLQQCSYRKHLPQVISRRLTVAPPPLQNTKKFNARPSTTPLNPRKKFVKRWPRAHKPKLQKTLAAKRWPLVLPTRLATVVDSLQICSIPNVQTLGATPPLMARLLRRLRRRPFYFWFSTICVASVARVAIAAAKSARRIVANVSNASHPLKKDTVKCKKSYQWPFGHCLLC